MPRCAEVIAVHCPTRLRKASSANTSQSTGNGPALWAESASCTSKRVHSTTLSARGWPLATPSANGSFCQRKGRCASAGEPRACCADRLQGAKAKPRAARPQSRRFRMAKDEDFFMWGMLTSDRSAPQTTAQSSPCLPHPPRPRLAKTTWTHWLWACCWPAACFGGCSRCWSRPS